MHAPDEIQSLTNPRVKRLVRLRKARLRREEGVLIAEGRREVERALQAGLVMRELWHCPELDPQGPANNVLTGQPSQAQGPAGGPAPNHVQASAAVFRKIAYHRDPEGLLALFAAPQLLLDDLTLRRGRLLVAVGTEKPGNLGAMVRTAAAAGCDAVLAVGPAVDIYNPNAIRNSTGAVFELPVVVVPDDAEAIAWLNQRGIRIAAALSAEGETCFAADLAASRERPLAVVIGPEHAGLGPAWRDAAELGLTIPAVTDNVVDSLNASAAAAVLVFEVLRQSEHNTGV